MKLSSVSLFGFLSLGLLPVPIIFIRYGAQLRENSKFGKEARAIMQAIRARQQDTETISAKKELEVISESTNVSNISASTVDVVTVTV